MTEGGKLGLLALAGFGALLLLNRGPAAKVYPISRGGIRDDAAALVDPGGGALVSPLSIPVDFPPYGQGGYGSSSVWLSAAAGALTAPLAGQTATTSAIANAVAAGGGPNQTGRSSGTQVYGGADGGPTLPGSSPVYHPPGSGGGAPPSSGGSAQGSGGGGYKPPPPAPKPPAPGPVNVQGQGRSSGGQTG
jgi:hypothetical protein